MINGIKNKTEKKISFGNIEVFPNGIILISDNVIREIIENKSTLLSYSVLDICFVDELEQEIFLEKNEDIGKIILKMFEGLPLIETQKRPVIFSEVML